MAPQILQVFIASSFLLVLLILVQFEPSECRSTLKGSVSCLDCNDNYDLSGVAILVKCEKPKGSIMATTQSDGSFATRLSFPLNNESFKCFAKIIGGPKQLYVFNESMFSKVVVAQDDNPNEKVTYYTIPSLLNFTTCPVSMKDGKCGSQNAEFDSSKTFDFPLPREWGLAPSSYYFPVIPIIGIP